MSSSVHSRPRVEGEREEQILDATVRLLLEVGYDRLTLDAVALKARASGAAGRSIPTPERCAAT